MPNALRAALYLRVSTDQQTTDNQRPELVALARQRGFSIEAVYDDTGSAIKQRPEFDRMTLDAHRGKFDVLLVWSLDRLGRSVSAEPECVPGSACSRRSSCCLRHRLHGRRLHIRRIRIHRVQLREFTLRF